MTAESNVRVRVAPSPTGDPHVGTAYVTLFNYVFAKKHSGKLILRIEDTDQTRYRKSSEDRIISSLRWLNLPHDEGPDIGGDYGPYRQSERKKLYSKYAQELLDKGKAYRCFCTADRLKEMREKQKQEGSTFGYDRHCRDLDKVEVQKRVDAGELSVVRLAMPLVGKGGFKDELRGLIEIDYKQLDDQVLLKSDGFPTYHLANVVDDHLMKITHVIRAEEWISSTPKHVVLYEAFGWQQPQFIHLPLLRNSDKSKISKRKNPVSLDFYRRKGVLPEAMNNFMALMGWSYKDDIEVFSLEQMIEVFEFSKVSLGGPIFDQKKLAWLNQQYIQKLSDDSFVNKMQEEVFSKAYLQKIFPLVKERLETFDQFCEKFSFFFTSDLNYEGLAIVPKSKSSAEMIKAFAELSLLFDEIDLWEASAIKEKMNEHLKSLGWKAKEYFMPLRLVLTGRKDSPPLVETIEALGKDIIRYRLQKVVREKSI